jgi:hypothetical protein
MYVDIYYVYVRYKFDASKKSKRLIL